MIALWKNTIFRNYFMILILKYYQIIWFIYAALLSLIILFIGSIYLVISFILIWFGNILDIKNFDFQYKFRILIQVNTVSNQYLQFQSNCDLVPYVPESGTNSRWWGREVEKQGLVGALLFNMFLKKHTGWIILSNLLFHNLIWNFTFK